MKRKPLIYASCATARDPIHINILDNDGEGTFNRYDLEPFKAFSNNGLSNEIFIP